MDGKLQKMGKIIGGRLTFFEIVKKLSKILTQFFLHIEAVFIPQLIGLSKFLNRVNDIREGGNPPEEGSHSKTYSSSFTSL